MPLSGARSIRAGQSGAGRGGGRRGDLGSGGAKCESQVRSSLPTRRVSRARNHHGVNPNPFTSIFGMQLS